jgi:hypothetical protein
MSPLELTANSPALLTKRHEFRASPATDVDASRLATTATEKRPMSLRIVETPFARFPTLPGHTRARVPNELQKT